MPVWRAHITKSKTLSLQIEEMKDFETLAINDEGDNVLHVKLNRAAKLNTFSNAMWDELRELFGAISTSNYRCVVVSGEGRMFSAGVDLNTFGSLAGGKKDAARTGMSIYNTGKLWQASLTAIAECLIPVVVCVHGKCIGAGLELISACDIRYCSSDAEFILKEADAGLASDVGGLQRFPKLVGNDSTVREMAMTCRPMGATEAQAIGLVSKVLVGNEDLLTYGINTARTIARKSPVVIAGTKKLLNYSRDHSALESLEYAITWNMAMLQGSDMQKAVGAFVTKKTPDFEPLFDKDLASKL